MRLKQAVPASATIQLVPMIDVLMIMLVFFMVTSTYLNLRMIPMAEGTDAPATDAAPATGTASALLIRLDADGIPRLRGTPVRAPELKQVLEARLAETPALSVVLLPSGQASTQDLVSLLDVTTAAGVRQIRLVRLGEAP
ncbi:biopolymer transporter ExbD [Tropicimonas sp. IMCC6043]|uniref:ExbD/TolR family protein n=1 Tax=Tropicimonas sp. IMCC6043 TaxID=2510645 RepID=UPI00101B7A1E|nr:biopolymer transporter ExbD [Tropicimonas sp. IMCC6043]RYH09340.1 biopolymer transporter ExbD [Tropicimonas sp. IMCC6043]